MSSAVLNTKHGSIFLDDNYQWQADDEQLAQLASALVQPSHSDSHGHAKASMLKELQSHLGGLEIIVEDSPRSARGEFIPVDDLTEKSLRKSSASAVQEIDRDGDGLIYDGTKYERPAPSKPVDPRYEFKLRLASLNAQIPKLVEESDKAMEAYYEKRGHLKGTGLSDDELRNHAGLNELRDKWNRASNEKSEASSLAMELKHDLKILEAGDTKVDLALEINEGIDVHPAIAQAALNALAVKPWADESQFLGARYKFELEEYDDRYRTFRFEASNLLPPEPMPDEDLIVDEVPEEDGFVYRGMSWEEWQATVDRGYIASRGDHNLEGQDDLTFYGSASTASHYASGFAPIAFSPAPGRPGVVIKIPRDLVMDHTEHSGIPNSEYAHKGSIPIDSIKERFELISKGEAQGRIEARQDHMGNIGEGSRSIRPGSYVVSRVEKDRVLTKKRHFEGRVATEVALTRAYKGGGRGFNPLQPRDDWGRWVDMTAIRQAAVNDGVADELRARVTKPEQQEKLDAAIEEEREAIYNERARSKDLPGMFDDIVRARRDQMEWFARENSRRIKQGYTDEQLENEISLLVEEYREPVELADFELKSQALVTSWEDLNDMQQLNIAAAYRDEMKIVDKEGWSQWVSGTELELVNDYNWYQDAIARIAENRGASEEEVRNSDDLEEDMNALARHDAENASGERFRDFLMEHYPLEDLFDFAIENDLVESVGSIEEWAKRGGFNVDDIPSLVGAPENTYVEAELQYDQQTMVVSVSDGDEYIQKMERAIHVSRSGDVTIMNTELFLNGEWEEDEETEERRFYSHAPDGWAMGITERQVATAKRIGARYIKTNASRSSDMIGYYVWPRRGFDQPMSMFNIPFNQEVERRFPYAKTVLDILATKEGRQWWRENGNGMTQAKFDLSDNSRSLKTLAAYRMQREGIKGDA